jgi:hypothetical protein
MGSEYYQECHQANDRRKPKNKIFLGTINYSRSDITIMHKHAKPTPRAPIPPKVVMTTFLFMCHICCYDSVNAASPNVLL